MKIEKGQKYLCVSDVETNKYRKLYLKGKIYKSENNDCITDEDGYTEREWDIHGKPEQHFQPLSSAKWAIKRTPENAEELNMWIGFKLDGVSEDVVVYSTKKWDYTVDLLDGYTEIDFETFKEITGMGEEKPKQLLGEKEAVHCPTLELAEKVIDILKGMGCEPMQSAKEYWEEYGNYMTFVTTKGTINKFQVAPDKYWTERGYTIIPAEQFIKDNEPKIFTIEDVRNGKCDIINDGSIEHMRMVLAVIFPKDNGYCAGKGEFYGKSNTKENSWVAKHKTDLPTQSVKLFLSQIEGEKEQTKVEECQPKAENEFSPKWGEEVEVRDYAYQEWSSGWLYVMEHPLDIDGLGRHIVTDKEGMLCQFYFIRKPLAIHTFTTEQAKQDLAKLHNLNVNQIKITE